MLAHLINFVRKRGWWLALGVLVLPSVFLVSQVASVTNTDAPISHHHDFELNFDGLVDGRFPDGSRFVLSRLLSDEVLERALINNDIQPQAVSLERLRNALYIESHIPNFQAIRARYNTLLNNEGLSAVELAEQARAMQREIALQQSGSIRLTLQWRDRDGVIADQAEQLLRAIPAAWAERAVSEQGVLRVNRAIHTERIFATQRYMAMDYPIAIDLLRENIGLLRQDIAALRALPGGDEVQDTRTQLRLIDVDKRLEDIIGYELRRLIDPVLELGLTKDRAGAILYLRRELREIRLEQAFWVERAQHARTLLTGIDASADAELAAEDGVTAPVNAVSASASAQGLDDSFLNRLVELAEQGDNQAFRQSLTRQVLRFEETALSLDRRIQRLERSLTAVREGSQTPALAAEYQSMIEAALPDALATLREQTQILSRLSDRMGARATGDISLLVSPVQGSYQAVGASLLPHTALPKALAIALLGGLVALLLALGMRAYRP